MWDKVVQRHVSVKTVVDVVSVADVTDVRGSAGWEQLYNSQGEGRPQQHHYRRHVRGFKSTARFIHDTHTNTLR